MQTLVTTREQGTAIRALPYYLVLVYLAQGLSQHFCLIAQPLDNFLLKTLHWNAAQTGSLLALLMVPWTLKPLFGLASDGIGILKENLHISLAAALALGAAGYLLAAGCNWQMLAFSLIASSAGMACASALFLGFTVRESDQHKLPNILSAQTMGYYAAAIGAGLLGGRLCNSLTPGNALQTALCIGALVCLVTSALTMRFPRRTTSSLHRRPITAPIIFNRLCSKSFVLAAVFTFCVAFSPGFGTPLYYHYTNILQMSQSAIGEANSWNALGMMVGASLFSPMWRKSPHRQIQFSLCFSVFATLAFIFVSAATASIFEFLRGASTTLCALSITGVAARVSPRGLETITTASVIGIYNLATQLSVLTGSLLYVHAFKNQLLPLLLVSAGTTACCCFLNRSTLVASHPDNQLQGRNAAEPVSCTSSTYPQTGC